jgi:hypothetical protein
VRRTWSRFANAKQETSASRMNSDWLMSCVSRSFAKYGEPSVRYIAGNQKSFFST